MSLREVNQEKLVNSHHLFSLSDTLLKYHKLFQHHTVSMVDILAYSFTYETYHTNIPYTADQTISAVL